MDPKGPHGYKGIGQYFDFVYWSKGIWHIYLLHLSAFSITHTCTHTIIPMHLLFYKALDFIPKFRICVLIHSIQV